jgi:hypothetical protein
VEEDDQRHLKAEFRLGSVAFGGAVVATFFVLWLAGAPWWVAGGAAGLVGNAVAAWLVPRLRRAGERDRVVIRAAGEWRRAVIRRAAEQRRR